MKATTAYEKMKGIMKEIYKTADGRWLVERSKELMEQEWPQTFSAYHNAAEYTYDLLVKNGFDAEMLRFPADGETVYLDMRTPLAWEASVGRLTVKNAPIPFENPVVADYAEMPFSLVKHSVSTPKGGTFTRLVTESQVYAGEDCTGAMVLLEPETPPRPEAIVPLLDLGAMGFVSDYVKGAVDTPDCVQWVNNATEGNHWHVQADDRDFIGFSISPRAGRKLRQAACSGSVDVLVESDGRRYAGEVHAVTALMKGKRKEELWVLAHLYEPLSLDNSSGVVGAIGSLIKIREMLEQGSLPPLEYSIRVVFAMESYGFAAVAEHFGGDLRSRAIGAINMDCVPAGTMDNEYVKVSYAPLSTPFFGNFILKMAVETYNKEFQYPVYADSGFSFGDDMFLSDTTTGLPTVWPDCDSHTIWHNSVQSADTLDEEYFKRVLVFFATWIGVTACMGADELPVYYEKAIEMAQNALDEEAERKINIGGKIESMEFWAERLNAALASFNREKKIEDVVKTAMTLKMPAAGETSDTIARPWLDYADSIIPKRLTCGLPFDLIRLPKSKRKALPDGMLYGPMAFILSAMDGEKTLKRAICEAAWENHADLSEKAIKRYIDAVLFLAEAGYLSVQHKNMINHNSIVSALKNLGIKNGDILLVHGALSQVGYVEGGADTVIDALIEAVGKEGTILMPAFTRPYIAFEGTCNKRRDYRPFSAEDKDHISTGTIAKTLLQRKNTRRSAHATHSWCGVGAKAEECLREHALLDSPASDKSPMAVAHKLGGKVLFFGCDMTCNTFLHFLEDQSEAPFLQNAVIKVRGADGNLHTEVIKNHLPGDRDFYHSPAAERKFYRRAMARGLKIEQEDLGMGILRVIELQSLYRIGMELFAEDPFVTLCDNYDCTWCRKFFKPTEK